MVDLKVPVLIRAPLVHYYYEQIHPFWDGNGRVGRVIEASLLLGEGFRYAPFAQARYYLDRSTAISPCSAPAARRRTRACPIPIPTSCSSSWTAC
ncbi:Fic family protein [uncultured Thiodictyon sp.]|uniref:Fic family protein n=1 Tax=uncultured Thiodictyon sp. TaxID=1846217 RepID=UPI00341C306C